jgi:hypothetical protein
MNGRCISGCDAAVKETHKWFIENSRVHFTMIIQDILEKQSQHSLIYSFKNSVILSFYCKPNPYCSP